MRIEITKKFLAFLQTYHVLVKKVAIVGGTSKDPEVEVIKNLYPGSEIHFLNLDNPHNDFNFHLIDINKKNILGELNSNFDLVVSSQVIEHIWNHENYFSLLVNLTSASGLIYLNCPKSNMVHGSPDYFAAGFTADYLASNLVFKGCEIVESGELGNKRYYLGVHFGRYWQTPSENRHSVLNYNFQPGTLKGKGWKFLRDLPIRLLLTTITADNSENLDFATESFVWARRS